MKDGSKTSGEDLFNGRRIIIKKTFKRRKTKEWRVKYLRSWRKLERREGINEEQPPFKGEEDELRSRRRRNDEQLSGLFFKFYYFQQQKLRWLVTT